MKKNKGKKVENKYPNVILGLDISTSCIGISIVYDDGETDPKIIEITHISPKIPSKIKGIEALILRKEIFEKEFLTKKTDLHITECVIESPLIHASGKSNAQTVAQLLQFNGLLSEAVYRVLGIVPNYVSSYDARMQSFPELMAVRRLNKKGELYPLSHYKKSLKDNHLILFGAYSFDCDKKSIMMDMVSEKFPDIKWILDKNGEIKKENYDACDSLVCVLAYINTKRHGELDNKIENYEIETFENGETVIDYTVKVWDREYTKKIILKKV